MKQTFTSLMRRLSRAGFKKEFVASAILPDWWDVSCAEDPKLLPDIEVRLARFLGRSVAAVRDANAILSPPIYGAAQLRRVRDVDRDRLGPAIHSGIRIAEAVVRNLVDRERHPSMPPSQALPKDALAWREGIAGESGIVTLHHILSDLWGRGIAVIPVDVLPSPNFQGMSCIVEGRPVILLGHKHDEPGRVAFLVAHEVGHVVAGDCKPDQPVVDEEEEIADDADIERRADEYATRVLIGGDTVPGIEGASFKELARRASDLERERGADASMLIFAWARRTGDYATATMAVRALYRHLGARHQLRAFFDRHVDVTGAGETDRALLRCVAGDSERVEAAG